MPSSNPCCNKVNTRSTNDQEQNEDSENCKSDKSSSEKDFKCNLKSETVGFVKSLLGPSLEDSVLKTLEFGKSLMHKSEELDQTEKSKNYLKSIPKEIPSNLPKDLNLEVLLEERTKNYPKRIKNGSCEKQKKNSVTLTAELENDHPAFRQINPAVPRKLSNVSKIRSLDSDLKQCAPSPEKIKKQLEALIQINKDEPPEQPWNIMSKKTKIPNDITVMPSLCVYKNETEMNFSSSCDVQSQVSKAGNEEETASRSRNALRKRNKNKICQAPEFISNALGPTIDVSIIDNLKMMRDLFKYDSGKGEGSTKEPLTANMKQEIRLQSSEGEMTCRLDELQKKIEELEDKEQCLLKQIEEEERQRECLRKAFQEEEKCINEKKAFLETLASGKKQNSGKSLMECNLNAKLENIQAKVACEEEKLGRLKAQYEQYKRELAEAKFKKEALKRNKALLDAWDIFASRVCHTRLPSFSKAYCLERKSFQQPETTDLHCCFPPTMKQSATLKTSAASSVDSSNDQQHSQDNQGNHKVKLKMGEIQFPVQRDIVCGLHQMLKSCNCSGLSRGGMRGECEISKQTLSSEDAMNKGLGYHGGEKKNRSSRMEAESSTEIVLRSPCGDANPCRSKSDTSIRCQETCSKIIKVMWAVTRINIFQNNYRTYEIMEASTKPPLCIPTKTEGIFVVKSQKKQCLSPTKKKCPSKVGRR